MEQDKIFIIGGNHHNTLGVIRSLGYKGLKPIVLLVSDKIGKNNYVLRSKYISKFKSFINYQDVMDWLINNASENSGSVILCTSDGASSAVDMNYDKLAATYHIPNAKKEGVINHFMNKEIMSELARKIGMTVPPTYLYDHTNPLPKNIEFPCIIKPLLSIEGSKSDIKICNTFEELNSFIKDTSHCERIQIQKFIEKDYEYQLIGCSLEGGKKVIIPGVSHVIRPSKCSNTGFLRYKSLDMTYPVKLAKKFIQEIGYSGLFSMEFLRDKNGKDYFMEINFRNDGNAICVTASGVNLPYIWYLANSNKSIEHEPMILRKEVFVMPEFDDFVNVLKGKISLLSWIKALRSTDCFMEYDHTDVSPFIMGLFNQTKNFIKIGFSKFHKKL